MNDPSETIFAKIIRKEIPADIVFESETLLAFRDINPQAPTHILIIPKKFIRDVASITSEDKEILGEMLVAAREIAESEGLNQDGYRLVINNGEKAGQTVFHIHLHLLGGRDFNWPPG